jgi:GNAT superfamily N-acetyltransferase
VIVRDARPQDALAVGAVHVRSWQAGYRGLFPDEFLDALRAEDRAARYTFGSADPAAPRTILAVAGDAVLGFATTGRSRDEDARGAGELYALYVDPPSWGRGVGRTLMRHVHANLRELGVEHTLLWVLAGNTRAERFYRADGWLADGARRREDPWGIEAEVVRYRRAVRAGART